MKTKRESKRNAINFPNFEQKKRTIENFISFRFHPISNTPFFPPVLHLPLATTVFHLLYVNYDNPPYNLGHKLLADPQPHILTSHARLTWSQLHGHNCTAQICKSFLFPPSPILFRPNGVLIVLSVKTHRTFLSRAELIISFETETQLGSMGRPNCKV